jgi:hypothetical protein
MVNLNFLLHCPPVAYLYLVGVLWYMGIGELPKFPRCMFAPLICVGNSHGGGGHDQQNIQKLHFCVPQPTRSQHSTLGKTGDSGLRKPAPHHLLCFILSNLTAFRINGTMLQKI